jgi:hypothetical protein
LPHVRVSVSRGEREADRTKSSERSPALVEVPRSPQAGQTAAIKPAAASGTLKDAVVKELHSGRRIESRIGTFTSGLRGPPATQEEVGQWEADVSLLFDDRNRSDLTKRFLYDPPVDFANMLSASIGRDAVLKRRMKRRIATLNSFLREQL